MAQTQEERMEDKNKEQAGEFENLEIEPLSDEDLEAVAGGESEGSSNGCCSCCGCSPTPVKEDDDAGVQ